MNYYNKTDVQSNTAPDFLRLEKEEHLLFEAVL